jgi:hypothetical protein
MPKKIWFLLLALLLCLVTYVIYGELDRPLKRKQNFGLVKGVVVSVSMDILNGYSADITYKTTINNKEISRTKRLTSDRCSDMRIFMTLMNQKMEVVYEMDDIENCDLLVSRKEYQEYKIMPPREVARIIDALVAGCNNYE